MYVCVLFFRLAGEWFDLLSISPSEEPKVWTVAPSLDSSGLSLPPSIILVSRSLPRLFWSLAPSLDSSGLSLPPSIILVSRSLPLRGSARSAAERVSHAALIRRVLQGCATSYPRDDNKMQLPRCCSTTVTQCSALHYQSSMHHTLLC